MAGPFSRSSTTTTPTIPTSRAAIRPSIHQRYPALSSARLAHAEARGPGARGPRRHLAYLDLETDRLLTELESRGVLENTLVIITSDHGEQFGSTTS